MNAKIIRLDETVELPRYETHESAGFDIAINQDGEIKPNEIKMFSTGLVIEAPENHFLMLVARSSLPTKKGLRMANSIGIVDRDYAGPNDEIFVKLHNITNEIVSVKKGEKLIQGIFIRIDQVQWNEVPSIRTVNRDGFGSTGGYETN